MVPFFLAWFFIRKPRVLKCGGVPAAGSFGRSFFLRGRGRGWGRGIGAVLGPPIGLSPVPLALGQVAAFAALSPMRIGRPRDLGGARDSLSHRWLISSCSWIYVGCVCLFSLSLCLLVSVDSDPTFGPTQHNRCSTSNLPHAQ